MLEVYVPILVLLLLALAWHDALGARELARAHARRLCSQARLQLLDETVSLRRLRLRRPTGQSLQLQREYAFEVSSNGNDRLTGHVRLAGQRLQSWSLPTHADAALR